MIICAGESLIDMVSFKGEPEYTPHVGGSNFNSSIALGRLGLIAIILAPYPMTVMGNL
jgi:fructokinase